ncbi:MAG: hypothetical protein EOP81_17490 [Variovorax sp.]|nr:MAG: hypothetical protein EOP81_17490 [Variovorax sp.]
MRHAPSVTYPVRGSQAVVALVASVWVLGAAAAFLASFQLDGIGWRQSGLMGCVAIVGLFAWRSPPCFIRQDLTFDGQHWTLGSNTPAQGFQIAAVEVAFDLQFLLLLRLSGPGRAVRWLWLSRRAMPSRWRDLRRAVYSRAPGVPPVSSSGHAAPVDRA